MTDILLVDPDGRQPAAHGPYQRLGTLPLEAVFNAIRGPASHAVAWGATFGVSSLRLQTFARSAPCCSDPTCGLQASHFAVERSLTKNPFNQDRQSWHLNLYGLDRDGREVLFTHDHTLARSLGGTDTADNTTTMCLPCNSRKSVHEHRLVKERRLAQGLPANYSPRGAAGEQQPTEESLRKALEQARRLFEQMRAVRGLGPVGYRIHCEAMGATFAQRNPLRRKRERYGLQAAEVGLSEYAYRYLRHDHNEHQKAWRRSVNPEPEDAPQRRPTFGGC